VKQQKMGNVTGYFCSAATGDPIADNQLFELIHADLERMAQGRSWCEILRAAW
jgi:hypothetical protein